MHFYVVGGAVRDVLMGNEPKDIDFCVVGSSHQEMVKLGYIPIEATSFPVFLDSQGNEYALARKEKKIGKGYHGFEVNFDSSVTLEEDLKRRDLTINSMAVNYNDWEAFLSTKDYSLVIDPFNGINDIKSKLINHTSKAFNEDPVRALRAARLAVRYDFNISYNTIQYIEDMVKYGELEHLTTERIWLEISKTIDDNKNVIRFFDILFDTGVFYKIFPFKINQLKIEHFCFDHLKNHNFNIPEYIFISIFNNNPLEVLEKLCLYLKTPTEYLKTIRLFCLIKTLLEEKQLTDDSIIKLFRTINVYNEKQSLRFLQCLEFIKIGCLSDNNKINILKRAYEDTSYKIGDIIPIKEFKGLKGNQIGEIIWNHRKNSINI